MKYANSGDQAVAELRSIRNYVTCLTVMVFFIMFPFGLAFALVMAGVLSLPNSGY